MPAGDGRGRGSLPVALYGHARGGLLGWRTWVWTSTKRAHRARLPPLRLPEAISGGGWQSKLRLAVRDMWKVTPSRSVDADNALNALVLPPELYRAYYNIGPLG